MAPATLRPLSCKRNNRHAVTSVTKMTSRETSPLRALSARRARGRPNRGARAGPPPSEQDGHKCKKGPQGISLLGSRSSHQAPNANRQARAPLRGPAAAIRARPAPPPFANGTGPSGGPAARCARSRRPEGRAARRRQSPCAVRGPKTQKGPQGEIPCGLSRRE